MNLILKAVLPILIIAACVVTAKVVVANRPEPQTRPQFKSTTSIDATRIQKSDYPVFINTQGTVGASREGSLVPEVAGRIINMSPNFVVGGSFRRDEVLLEIDPRDYQIAVTLAESTFAQSKATLAEESARSQQASEDWKRLGRKGEPSALTLRKPQLAAAKASLEAARAQVQRAQLDLDRTKITASYDGSVMSKSVDLGQFINKGSTLAEIYAIDMAEVRLPFNNQQLGFVAQPGVGDNSSTVILSADVGGTDYQWTGKITRSEGAIDAASRQLYMIAEVENPYNLQSDRPPLRVGQYVTAKVTGKVLNDVYVIPRAALREEREVLIVDELNTLQSRSVNVVWKDAETAVINDGLSEGDIISITALGTVTNGTRVRATVDGVAPPNENRRGKPENTTDAPTTSTAGSDKGVSGGDRLAQLKAIVDAGGALPDGARMRFEARIAAGEPVPQWLQDHLNKSTN